MPEGDFYIGYHKRTAPALGRFLRRLVPALLLAAGALAALLAALQAPFDRGVFEFGIRRSLAGTVRERPYPRLLLPRPGAVTPSSLFLVSFGKHGAAAAVRGLDGRQVSLAGSLIYRDDQAMLELEDGSLTPLDDAPAGVEAVEELGTRRLRGEIVDSKCYLGVMKPGRRKPHRACAALCIRGGIPPLLRVEGADGRIDHLLLVGNDGRPIGKDLLEKVAEPVEVTGRVERHGDLLVLFAEPADVRRLGD